MPLSFAVDVKKGEMSSSKILKAFKQDFNEDHSPINKATNFSNHISQQQCHEQHRPQAEQHQQELQRPPYRIHFLPHQQISSPTFPTSPISSISPASKRRCSHQQHGNSCSKTCWDESLQQLSRDLKMICRSGSRESLSFSNSSGANSRPSSPFKSPQTPIAYLPKISSSSATKSQNAIETNEKNFENLPPVELGRIISLDMEKFDDGALRGINNVLKVDENPLRSHSSDEDIAGNYVPKSILKTPENISTQNATNPLVSDSSTNGSKPISFESTDQVFENETETFPRPHNFGFPRLTLKKIKVRHDETEVSLNRTLAKICRNNNSFIAQRNPSESESSSIVDDESDSRQHQSIGSQLHQLETPVVVVANFQHLWQQKPHHYILHETACELSESGHLEQICESMREEKDVNEIGNEQKQDMPISPYVENKQKDFEDWKLNTKKEEARQNVIMRQKFDNDASQNQELNHSSTPPIIRKFNDRYSLGSCVQAYRRKKLVRLSQVAKSLEKSFENIGIRFKVHLKDRNPYSVGVSVDEEAGFLTVFATSYSKFQACDGGYNYAKSANLLGNDSMVIKPLSSDVSETPIIEQLHLLRIGESTKAECLRCTIEDGVLRIREKENEAEFLNFEGSTTKYLPIVAEDFSNCQIAVTLFVPPEFRKAVAVKTIDNILVFSGTKDRAGGSEKYGSRTSQEVSDDDDGYEAASEMSYSSSSFTPPTSASSLTFNQSPLAFNISASSSSISPLAAASSSSSFNSITPAIPIPSGSQSASNHAPTAYPTFKVALNLPPETITRTIESWMTDCGQLIVVGQIAGMGRRMTCNF